MECLRCKALTEAIDELSEMLSHAQRSRRQARRQAKLLQDLLIMDMEAEHDSISIRHIEATVGLPEYQYEGLTEGQG